MPVTLSAVLAALVLTQVPSDPIDLAIGDPARKTRTVTVVMDRIVDTASGQHVSPAGLARALSDARLVLVGEQHSSVEAHRVQRQVIEALHASGRPVLLGVEMFPYTAQPALDQWRAQAISEREFVAASKWYEHWGYHWRYYRDIFLFARDHKLPIVAINAPRDVVSAVRKKGLDKLTPEEARHIPREIATSDPEHLTLFKAYFGGDSPMHQGTSDESWRSMLDAQATWDATMAYQAVRALEAMPRKDAVMVVLAGSGHVAYALGIERQARRWLSGRIATVIPVPLGARDSQGVTVSRLLRELRVGCRGRAVACVSEPGHLDPSRHRRVGDYPCGEGVARRRSWCENRRRPQKLRRYGGDWQRSALGADGRKDLVGRGAGRRASRGTRRNDSHRVRSRPLTLNWRPLKYAASCQRSAVSVRKTCTLNPDPS
jgi:uncharacterized iron-regulated protein